MAAEEIITSAHCQAHQPMFERGFATKAFELLKGLKPDFLDDVLDLAFAAGVAASGGKDAGRILLDQRLEAGRITFEHCSDEIRFATFHRARGAARGPLNRYFSRSSRGNQAQMSLEMEE